MTIQILRTATPNNPPTGLDPGQLAVEMANNPPRLWCGVPASIDPSERVAFVFGGGGDGDFSTGDAKITLDTVAEPGWILMDDGTIGDAQSGATTRADDDCGPLFRLLWHLGDIGLPVFPSRGASAEADWAAHKSISLPRQLGRAIVGAGQGAGISSRQVGSFFGEEYHQQTIDELPQHAHGGILADPTHNHAGSTGVTAVANGYHWLPSFTSDLTFFQWYSSGQGITINGATVGIAISDNGASQPFSVAQPSTAWNIMLKL